MLITCIRWPFFCPNDKISSLLTSCYLLKITSTDTKSKGRDIRHKLCLRKLYVDQLCILTSPLGCSTYAICTNYACHTCSNNTCPKKGRRKDYSGNLLYISNSTFLNRWERKKLEVGSSTSYISYTARTGPH